MAVRMDPRADRSRTIALQVARSILVDEGWDALTHARVAEMSGLHRATIYRHWPTPTALLHDLLAQEAAIAQLTPTGDLRADLISVLAVVHHEVTERDFGRVLTALIDRSEWDAELRQIKFAITRDGVASIHRVIHTATEHGDLPAGLDPDASAALLVGPILFRRLLSGEAITPDFIERIVDHFLAGQAGPRP